MGKRGPWPKIEVEHVGRYDFADTADKMNWPIEGDDFETMTFEYSAEELGIDPDNAAKIEEIKDRRGRTLSSDDIDHYEKIVVALAETIRLMKEVDEVIEGHGGWPGAFAGQVLKEI